MLKPVDDLKPSEELSLQNDMLFLEKTIQEMIIHENLNAYIAVNLNREIDDSIPTAAVTFDSNAKDLLLKVNVAGLRKIAADNSIPFPFFFNIVLEHEFFHLMLDHLSRLKTIEAPHIIKNYGADMAVNSLIAKKYGINKSTAYDFKHVASIFIMPESYHFINDQTAEYYIKKLMDLAQEQSGSDGSIQKMIEKLLERYPIDGKDFEEISDENETGLNRAIGKLKTRTIEAINAIKSRGSGAGFDKELMDWLYEQVTVPWPKIFERLIHTGSLSKERELTYRIPNRRRTRGMIRKGRVYIPGESIFILIDTSGSMNEHDFKIFKGVLKNAVRNGYDGYIMQWDSAQQSEPVLISKFIRNSNLIISGRGGTDMTEGVRFIEKEYPHVSRVFIVTDGGTLYFTKDNPSPFPGKTHWLLTNKECYENFKTGSEDVFCMET